MPQTRKKSANSEEIRRVAGKDPADDRASPFQPMEALLAESLPNPPGWQFEPKWDGFRAIIKRVGNDVEIWSKSGKTLARYFPEIEREVRAVDVSEFTLDGELVIPIGQTLSFDALQARLHPATSRIAKLSHDTPAQLILFDCLRIGDIDFSPRPLTVRRAALEELHSSIGNEALLLSPVTSDRSQAERWLAASGGALDGVIAKPIDQPYRPGARAMVKVKQMRTADCVIGGYREQGDGAVASLLLGLYDENGQLDLVGFSASFSVTERVDLARRLKPFRGGLGFTGRAPGGPSRWNPDKSGDYIKLDHELVVEVLYDQVTAGRFRHGTRLLRWRPDKAPRQCTAGQLVRELKPAELLQIVDQTEASNV